MSELSNYINTKELQFQKIKLLDGKSIGIKPWRMKEEKQLLFSIETNPENEDYVTNQILILSRSCVDKPELFDILSRNNLLKVISEQRKLAKGDDIEINYRCINEECADFDAKLGYGSIPLIENISIDENLELELFTDEVLKYKDFKFVIKEVPYTKQRVLEDKYLKGDSPAYSKFNYELLINSVTAIKVKDSEGEIKEITNFTRDEIDSIIDSMDSSEYEKFVEKYINNLSGFKLEKIVTCPTCSKEQPVLYENLFEMLVF